MADYAVTDQGADSFAMQGGVLGMGGRGFFENGKTMTKGTARACCNIAVAGSVIAKGVGTASAVAGPIGAAANYALDTCITFYEAYGDIGKAHSKVAALEALQNKPGTASDIEEMLEWLINKLKRREMYAHAETGGARIMAKGVQEQWNKGGAGNKALAIGMGAGTGVATVVGTVAGQAGTKMTRAFRGIGKKFDRTFRNGKNNRDDYAKALYAAATGGDVVAKKIISIVMTAGIAQPSMVEAMQARIDSAVTDALKSAMSSFKE
jgi:hypothetical protein